MLKMKKIKGETWEEMDESYEETKHWPKLHLELKHLPEAKDWKIGDTYVLQVEAKMDSLDMDGKKGRVGFDITGIAVVPKKKPKRVKKRYSV